VEPVSTAGRLRKKGKGRGKKIRTSAVVDTSNGSGAATKRLTPGALDSASKQPAGEGEEFCSAISMDVVRSLTYAPDVRDERPLKEVLLQYNNLVPNAPLHRGQMRSALRRARREQGRTAANTAPAAVDPQKRAASRGGSPVAKRLAASPVSVSPGVPDEAQRPVSVPVSAGAAAGPSNAEVPSE
jgi:hypothetical protein